MSTQEKAGNLLPQVFSYTDKPVHVEIINNSPWFKGIDVCKVLSITNAKDVIRRQLDDDEKGRLKVASGQSPWFVNESGLYNLIFRSNKPNAKNFRRWITNDVLPAIRRTGSYGGLLLPTRVHSREVNGRKVYPFAKLAKSLGYKSGGSLYYRRRVYPNHFIKLDRMWHASEEMKQLMQISRSAVVHRASIKNMQPVLPLDFGTQPLTEGGAL